MTQFIKPVFPILGMLIAAGALLVLTGCAVSPSPEETPASMQPLPEAATPEPAPRSATPFLDDAAPAGIETATFALG